MAQPSAVRPEIAHTTIPHLTDIADDTYRNYYACACGHAWSDDYSCKIGDRCPSCGAATEPHTSEILMTEPEWIAKNSPVIGD